MYLALIIVILALSAIATYQVWIFLKRNNDGLDDINNPWNNDNFYV